MSGTRENSNKFLCQNTLYGVKLEATVRHKTTKLSNHFFLMSLTNSSSSGTRDKRSSTSLFVTACGRMILLENLMMPHINSKALIGIKCSTSIAPNNRRAVIQLNSGTEKLKVLRRKFEKRFNVKLIFGHHDSHFRTFFGATYFLTLSPNEAKNPIVF
jgi:hypothetical protein